MPADADSDAVVVPDGVRSDPLPADDDGDAELSVPPGRSGALASLRSFLDGPVDHYPEQRDDAAADATSRLSAALHFGCLHPGEILDRLDRSRPGHEAFARQIAWRDFYAQVLADRPDSAWANYRPEAAVEVDVGPETDAAFTAWCHGRTGFPYVDAGMRQLMAEGWMHNRLRMVTASFLVKDLHLDWRRGARHFLRHLVDGDIANNNHGWQWVAGTGTDASPYHRIFNPTSQGRRFDPEGRYIRRWVPELAEVDGDEVTSPRHPRGRRGRISAAHRRSRRGASRGVAAARAGQAEPGRLTAQIRELATSVPHRRPEYIAPWIEAVSR